MCMMYEFGADSIPLCALIFTRENLGGVDRKNFELYLQVYVEKVQDLTYGGHCAPITYYKYR